MGKLIDHYKVIFSNVRFWIIIIVTFIFIFAGYVMRGFIQDPMTKLTFFHIGTSRFDVWSLSHLILYMIFGYMFPDFFVEFLIIGAGWELFETIPCSNIFWKLMNCPRESCTSCRLNPLCSTMKRIDNCDYWYGKWSDIAVNMLGFVIGSTILRRAFHKN